MRYGRAVFVLVSLAAGHGLLAPNVNGQGAMQASITGIVRDSSGAVLPGVTVEASSDVLIEKVRAGITDATGRYRIAGLPTGTYNLTFTLPGFSTVRREGLELAGSFVATVNVDLQVGALAETITVTGEAPVVDVSSAQRQQVIDREVMASIPANRSYEGLAALVPGIQLATTAQNVGGIKGPCRRTSPGMAGALRRTAAHRRDDHRRLHRRRLAHGARYGQRGRDHGEHDRGAGRRGERGGVDQHRAALGREHLPGNSFSWVRAADAERQFHTGVEGCRLTVSRRSWTRSGT